MTLMNDTPHEDEHGTEEEGGAPGTMGRRGLVAAGLAGAVAVAVGRSDRVSAASGGPVILGGDNVASDQTSLVNTGAFPINGNRAMFISCEVMAGGRGVEASGSHAGVSAIGNSSKTQIPSGRAVGLEATTLDADGYGAVLEAGFGLAPLRLFPMGIDGSPTTNAHETGEILFDRNGRLFACTASGIPGTWVELGAVAPPAQAGTTLTMLATPERFVDTRTGLGGVHGPVPVGTTSAFAITGRVGQSGDRTLQIPDDAVAVACNLTVSGVGRVPLGSFVTMWSAGKQPPTPNLFFGAATLTGSVANGSVAGLAAIGTHRGVQVFNSAVCDYSLDVTGYFVAS